jgi:hypothetical protein
MADNVTVDNGGLTDYAVATDDVAGKHYQRVKLDVGGDGASVPVEGHVPVGALDADTADGSTVGLAASSDGILYVLSAGAIRLQINDASNVVSAWRSGAYEADAADGVGIAGSAPMLYNGSTWDRQRGDITNGLDVDVTRVSGTVNVADGGGSLTVDGTVSVNALPAGTANIGDVDVASIAAGDNNIGNVDVLTVPSPLSTAGNGTAAAAHRVTIASDSTGVIAVTDNGGSLTVDGTVAVTNAALTELAAAIDTEMQVDVVGALPAGTNNIGDVDIASALPAGDNNIGNVDVVTMPTVTIKTRADTATLSNVASSATSVTILATNTGRLGCSIQNDSTEVLYLKFGTTASSTSYTVKMAADAHYEVPFGYTGRIDGIWASANGNARVTELT